MEYGYKGPDPGTNIYHLLNGIRCDNISTAVVEAHPDRYKMDFNSFIFYLLHCVEKCGPITSFKVVSIAQSRPAKKQKTSEACGIFDGRIKLKKYVINECMSSCIRQNSLGARKPLFGMVRELSIEPIVLAKQLEITMKKAKKSVQVTSQRGIMTILHPSLSRQFRMNDCNFCYHCHTNWYFLRWHLQVQFLEGAITVHR